jgi:hypothetical protein
MYTKFLSVNLKVRDHSEWEDNIKMDLWEIRWEGVDWIHLAQDRVQWRVLLKTVMNFQAAYNVGNLLVSRMTVSLSGRTPFRGVS